VPDQRVEEDEIRNSRASLGRMYQDSEAIVRQGETGSCMYVIQDGCVEVVKETDGQDVTLAILGESDFFGEMAIFENEVRAATVRAIGPARVLTIDSRNLLRRIHEDPYFAYRLVRMMSSRVRKLGIGYAYSNVHN
jgi:CRP-like cAMP-binding protein